MGILLRQGAKVLGNIYLICVTEFVRSLFSWELGTSSVGLFGVTMRILISSMLAATHTKCK
jgi:hypothetical protein